MQRPQHEEEVEIDLARSCTNLNKGQMLGFAATFDSCKITSRKKKEPILITSRPLQMQRRTFPLASWRENTSKLIVTLDLSKKIFDAMHTLRKTNPSFDSAYETYTQEYGEDVIRVNAPLTLANTVDPVILIFGRNCVVYYRDSIKELRGSLGRVQLKESSEYIIGRRQPQDSKLVVWSPSLEEEVEIEEYSARTGIIPSRVNSALVVSRNANEEIYFTDLCSSSGSIIVGEWEKSGPFIRVYDPGSVDNPSISFERTSSNRKGYG